MTDVWHKIMHKRSSRKKRKRKSGKSSLQTQGIVRIMWPPEATAEGRV